MNWLETGLVVMMVLGVVALFPRKPYQRSPIQLERLDRQVTSTPPPPPRFSDEYNGWNACRRADGRFVGVVRNTIRNDEVLSYVLEMANISTTTLSTDKDGKTVQHNTPALRTIRAYMLMVTREACPGR
jgi:hypothetical protein